MTHFRFVYFAPALFALALLALAGCDSGKTTPDGYRDLEWYALVPAAEIEALKHPAPVDHNGTMRAQQVKSYDTIPTLDGQKVRMAGYIVPLEADDKGNLTEFFLVPYYGACIHVPPPPANQIVYVKSAEGFEVTGQFEPVWITGTLKVTSAFTGLAEAGYSLEADRVEHR